MARKKIQTPQSEPTLIEKIKKYENEISSILGMLLVIIIAASIFFLIRRSLPAPQISDQGNQSEVENLLDNENASTYTVKAGEGLWDVAVSVYNDGYKWQQIAEANNIVSPYVISAGQELTIPELDDTSIVKSSPEATVAPMLEATITPSVEPTTAPIATPMPAATPKESSSPDQVNGDAYTVARGDSLWKIAVAKYNDGYMWVKIYQANKELIGKNPGLIDVGQQLTIPSVQ